MLLLLQLGLIPPDGMSAEEVEAVLARAAEAEAARRARKTWRGYFAYMLGWRS